MSYGQTNGYTNGYRGQEQSNRYEEDLRQEVPTAGRRVRRAGGYGGFVAADVSEHPELGEQPMSPESPDPYNAPNIPSWRRAEARTPGREDFGGRDPSRNTDNGSRLYGDGPAGRQIEG